VSLLTTDLLNSYLFLAGLYSHNQKALLQLQKLEKEYITLGVQVPFTVSIEVAKCYLTLGDT